MPAEHINILPSESSLFFSLGTIQCYWFFVEPLIDFKESPTYKVIEKWLPLIKEQAAISAFLEYVFRSMYLYSLSVHVEQN